MAQHDQDRRQTKAERKEQARRERVELERRIASRKRGRRRALVLGVVVAAIVGGILFALSQGNTNAADGSASPSVSVRLPDPATLPGILRTAPPWPDNIAQANERLAQLSAITPLPQLGATLHHHANLLIYIDGQQFPVAAGIGYNPDANVFSPLHTHDTSGVVHVESADPTFQPVLGQFFDVWGVYLTKDCLGDKCAAGDQTLRAYVNGKEWTGDPTQIPLNDEQVIVLAFGSANQVPNPVPASFVPPA
ncbi:MAG: hypothetical protein E6G37_09680 [Actinobacteria bacterium]|nr:MAG: hypothetical protein E6G37_09680 [Actinomycetota bacterium]